MPGLPMTPLSGSEEWVNQPPGTWGADSVANNASSAAVRRRSGDSGSALGEEPVVPDAGLAH